MPISVITMTRDEVQVDLDRFIDSVQLRRKRMDQKPLFRGESFETDINSKSTRRRSSLLLDKVLRRGSYNFTHGADNAAFALKKGSSVSSSLCSSSSLSCDESCSQKSSLDAMKTPWFMGSKEIDLMRLDKSTSRVTEDCSLLYGHESSSKYVPSEETEEVKRIQLTEDEIVNYFSFFNISNDGYITKRQLKRSMEILGLEFSDDDLDIMIKTADVDSDGLISLDDFKSLPIILCTES